MTKKQRPHELLKVPFLIRPRWQISTWIWKLSTMEATEGIVNVKFWSKNIYGAEFQNLKDLMWQRQPEGWGERGEPYNRRDLLWMWPQMPRAGWKPSSHFTIQKVLSRMSTWTSEKVSRSTHSTGAFTEKGFPWQESKNTRQEAAGGRVGSYFESLTFLIARAQGEWQLSSKLLWFREPVTLPTFLFPNIVFSIIITATHG